MESRNARKVELKALGATQREIVEALIMSPTTVGNYFNGKPVAARSQADIERYLRELRAKRNNPEDGGPEAA